MNRIRKKIKLITILNISIQLGITFSLIIHNHTWHQLKLTQQINFNNENNTHPRDPFADDNGFCRINNYVPNSYSIELIKPYKPISLNESFLLSINFQNNYKFLFYYSTGLRSPPLS